MSYDIRFAVKVAGHNDMYAVIGEPERHSPTYNIGVMLRKCTGWDFKQSEWYKLTDVIPKIEHGIHELRFNEKEYEQYDAPNGWGTTQTALHALESILEWATDTFNRGWNADIPLEDIYICW